MGVVEVGGCGICQRTSRRLETVCDLQWADPFEGSLRVCHQHAIHNRIAVKLPRINTGHLREVDLGIGVISIPNSEIHALALRSVVVFLAGA